MKILVSDFDGVICDGLTEYFYSSKLVYQEIWQDFKVDLDSLQPMFNLLRPVVETGWEMPLLLKVLTWGETTENILDNWPTIREKAIKILDKEGVKVINLAQKLDLVRQRQINKNLDKWLNLHCFYDGVISKLKYLMKQNIKLYIITTKEGKFTRQLLEKADIFLPENAIMGKEVKRPKYESLRLIINTEKVKPSDVSFIEDRLEALELVHQQQDLLEVKLFLALWGYNDELTKVRAKNNPLINALSLANFIGNDVF
ncbi:HAD hydrolase-like protein [Geminocystis sp. GBBB08]|uniref:HAD family hydrolase n=1 Tax=Geminocystis sp. GBBB08 TaxID=2604140 RepID=UPI0027E3778A|nr:HAD hydrolase-like protein [Geminocystis sp. GBBB08]MBL1211034.1 HAD family hydrolase [Geminocystis sp. GBBB08]